jgi:S1-C subfamily serine protease
MQDTPARSGGRETRLLLVTIAVSVATLLLLARFRFPADAVQPTDPAPAPLERLAARATYDELASIMADLERRIAPSLEILAVQSDRPGATYVAAPRLTPNRAVALVARDERLAPATSEAPPVIIARDPSLEAAVVQVAEPREVVTFRSGTPRPGPRYVAIVEGTAQGPAVRPVYIGRTEVFQDPRGSGTLLSVIAAQQTIPRGAAVFNLEGAFVGLASERAGALTIVPAEVLRRIADSAQAQAAPPGDLGIEVQPLTTPLARAAGTDAGVMVSYVHPGGPAAEIVQTSDVIQAIDGTRITTVAGFQQVAQSHAPGTVVTVDVVRRGAATPVKLTAAAPMSGEGAADLGALLRTLGSAGTEVIRVLPEGAAARGGMQPGDIMVALNGRNNPSASDIERAFRALPSGGALLITIERAARHRVVTLEKP